MGKPTKSDAGAGRIVMAIAFDQCTEPGKLTVIDIQEGEVATDPAGAGMRGAIPN